MDNFELLLLDILMDEPEPEPEPEKDIELRLLKQEIDELKKKLEFYKMYYYSHGGKW